MIGRLRSLLGRLRAAPAPDADPPLPPAPNLPEELAGAGDSVDRWLARLQPRLYSSLSDDRIERLRSEHPAQVRATVDAADRIAAHRFQLLGSEPFVPVDPGRDAGGPYRPIDWYLDPVQRLRFPERVPIERWNLMEMRPGLADVKFPWELGRCQHWLPLAQAFRLTGDAKYATEIFDQHRDFMAANPVALGVNWTCTMDVALRAFNWAIATETLMTGGVPRASLAPLYESLFDHGHFIERHLENKYEVTSNHFLSNIVGLYGVAVVFKDVPSGQRWLARCREWLEQEMRVQVLSDGADYESSIPYHRLVAELFLAGWRLSHCEGRELSDDYRRKLDTMFDFFAAVLRPDGLMPQVGDADDGRVHVFSNYGAPPQDGRHLLAAASAVRQRSWPYDADVWSAWEQAWWGCEPVPPPGCAPVAQLFPEAGLAVVRDRGTYLLITNGKVGTNGFGNHKHNDLLSFEFHDRGTPLMVDPGSFVYTSDPPQRNLFRSTRTHNTVMVDDTEQNEFKEEWLFRMFERAKPEHMEFDAATDVVTYVGRHDGYHCLPAPVMHERSFRLDRANGALIVADRFSGSGRHRWQWSFHCAPGVGAEVAGAGVLLRASGLTWVLHCARLTEPAVSAGSYSPSYGVRLPAAVIRYEAAGDADGTPWSFILERAS